MIISTPKEKFSYREEIYRIGDAVTANGDSIYAGLLGKICEIRTGRDKQTDNESPEIYCKFYLPVLKAGIEELEKKYSELCKEEKKFEDNQPYNMFRRYSLLDSRYINCCSRQGAGFFFAYSR